MKSLRPMAMAAACALGTPWTASAAESNAWPGPVVRTDSSGRTVSEGALGPFIFSKVDDDGGRSSGVRPFYVHKTDPKGETEETTVLYPLFFYRRYGATYTWSVFDLINKVGRIESAPPSELASAPDAERNLDIWPVYFSHQSADPARSYQALFPIYGNVRDFLGYQKLRWTLFPLCVQAVKHGSETTYLPWPVIRIEHGPEHGFAIWPLFGHSEVNGRSSRSFYLWPLIWSNDTAPAEDAPAGTPHSHQSGFIPFYTHSDSPGRVDDSWLWPFLGRTDRTAPDAYHETRYFWPFFVQGTGATHTRDRWAPFYAHSVEKGVDSTWVLWPLYHRVEYVEGGLDQVQTRFLYFVGSDQTQRSVARPSAAPAVKFQVWPLFSSWDNGAGRSQFQAPSPIEPLFADNPHARETWSPLFALWRVESQAPGQKRTSLLWDAVTWAHDDRTGTGEFHIGPLFGMRKRADGRGWRSFWFDFSGKEDKMTAQAR